MYISIETPDILHIHDSEKRKYYGANQEWYRDNWQKKAGCGPTSCSHLMWYLSRTRKDCRCLANYDGWKQEGFVSLMEDVWKYVTPGRMGVNNTHLFCEGAQAYGNDHQVTLICKRLEIPRKKEERPDAETVSRFLCSSLESNTPVAFLNLSNGKVAHLESWHWVTLVAFCPQKMKAVMYDQGEIHKIMLGTWLKRSALGGGFVSIDIKKKEAQ